VAKKILRIKLEEQNGEIVATTCLSLEQKRVRYARANVTTREKVRGIRYSGTIKLKSDQTTRPEHINLLYYQIVFPFNLAIAKQESQESFGMKKFMESTQLKAKLIGRGKIQGKEIELSEGEKGLVFVLALDHINSFFEEPQTVLTGIPIDKDGNGTYKIERWADVITRDGPLCGHNENLKSLLRKLKKAANY
jgi:hypothetical protein